MKEFFAFDSEYFDYWPLYEAIHKFYPIGFDIDPAPKSIQHFEGWKQRSDLIVKHIHENKNFERWSSFQTTVGNFFNKEIIGTTYGQEPSWSSEMVIDHFENEKLIYYKKLCFAVSLLGNFFTIYGTDETRIKYADEKDPGGQIINAVTVSPVGEFEHYFTGTESMIREHFPSYKFVPYNINTCIIKGLQFTYGEPERTVFHALFHYFLEPNDQQLQVRGNSSYGSQEWGTGKKPPGWTFYPPGT